MDCDSHWDRRRRACVWVCDQPLKPDYLKSDFIYPELVNYFGRLLFGDADTSIGTKNNALLWTEQQPNVWNHLKNLF